MSQVPSQVNQVFAQGGQQAAQMFAESQRGSTGGRIASGNDDKERLAEMQAYAATESRRVRALERIEERRTRGLIDIDNEWENVQVDEMLQNVEQRRELAEQQRGLSREVGRIGTARTLTEHIRSLGVDEAGNPTGAVMMGVDAGLKEYTAGLTKLHTAGFTAVEEAMEAQIAMQDVHGRDDPFFEKDVDNVDRLGDAPGGNANPWLVSFFANDAGLTRTREIVATGMEVFPAPEFTLKVAELYRDDPNHEQLNGMREGNPILFDQVFPMVQLADLQATAKNGFAGTRGMEQLTGNLAKALISGTEDERSKSAGSTQVAQLFFKSIQLAAMASGQPEKQERFMKQALNAGVRLQQEFGVTGEMLDGMFDKMADLGSRGALEAKQAGVELETSVLGSEDDIDADIASAEAAKTPGLGVGESAMLMQMEKVARRLAAVNPDSGFKLPDDPFKNNHDEIVQGLYEDLGNMSLRAIIDGNGAFAEVLSDLDPDLQVGVKRHVFQTVMGMLSDANVAQAEDDPGAAPLTLEDLFDTPQEMAAAIQSLEDEEEELGMSMERLFAALQRGLLAKREPLAQEILAIGEQASGAAFSAEQATLELLKKQVGGGGFGLNSSSSGFNLR